MNVLQSPHVLCRHEPTIMAFKTQQTQPALHTAPAGLALTPTKDPEDDVAFTPAAPRSLGRVDGAIKEILKSPDNRLAEPDGTRQSTLTSLLKAADSSCAMIWQITPMTPWCAKQPSQHFFTI